MQAQPGKCILPADLIIYAKKFDTNVKIKLFFDISAKIKVAKIKTID